MPMRSDWKLWHFIVQTEELSIHTKAGFSDPSTADHLIILCTSRCHLICVGVLLYTLREGILKKALPCHDVILSSMVKIPTFNLCIESGVPSILKSLCFRNCVSLFGLDLKMPLWQRFSVLKLYFCCYVLVLQNTEMEMLSFLKKI